MSALHFADLDPAGGTGAPTHFWIAHIIERLPWALKKNHWRPKARRLEPLVGPVRVRPTLFINANLSHQPFEGSPDCAEPLPERQPQKQTKPLQIVIDSPERSDLRIFENPSVQNSEQRNLFTGRLQLEDHFLGDQDAVAHAAKAVRAVRLGRSHGAHILLR